MLKKNIGKSLSEMVLEDVEADGLHGDALLIVNEVLCNLSVEDVLHALINETDIEEVEYIFKELKEKNNDFGQVSGLTR